MRLNHDYVRDILLFIEEKLDYEDSGSAIPYTHKEMSDRKLLNNENFSNYNKSELIYSLEQLLQIGFISCSEKPFFHNGNLQNAKIIGITWDGHIFLDNIRNDTIWNAVKEKSKKVGKVSITALASAANSLANAMMTDPNAVNNFLQGIDNIGKMF